MRLEVNERGERTGWHLFDVPTMWAFMENQQTDNHWRLVAGWSRAYELTSTHLLRLKTYREGLAIAWPPEQSPASAAYCARLDYLIQHVQQVHDVAVANFSTLSVVTTAIAASRAELKKIHDEYEAGYQARLSHERRFKDRNAPTPPNLDFENLPATRRELEELNARARALMSSLSNTLVEASIQIKQPPPYTPPKLSRDSNESVLHEFTSVAPTIPPITPILPQEATNSSRPNTQLAPTVTPPGSGPVLGSSGTLTPLTPPPATTPPAIITHPAGPGATAPPIATPTTPTIPTAPPPPLPSGTPIGAPSTNNMTRQGSNANAIATPRAMPPGGLIGGIPTATTTHSPTSTQPARRINSFGGVIGSPSATIARTHPARNTAPEPIRQSIRHESQISRPWDPDHPWLIDHGVTPILLPPSAPTHFDPGPTIGQHR
ncbi:hypothetical protein [Polymorphospora lycopeni]|uniref:Uncharacterized protein n=1 Tax=Polymorphospora lycopeni TaxID=3140240 RepID=A0ABV5CJ96_9ACTN